MAKFEAGMEGAKEAAEKKANKEKAERAKKGAAKKEEDMAEKTKANQDAIDSLLKAGWSHNKDEHEISGPTRPEKSEAKLTTVEPSHKMFSRSIATRVTA